MSDSEGVRSDPEPRDAVARALYAHDRPYSLPWWDLSDEDREWYESAADAALAARELVVPSPQPETEQT